ncbi:probable E3 SUMO-protein ligase RNF212 [Engraulis encrasicolus]|uniref:probable E3 SUMO-protein ligase RNF212 n=1 Tax=Engraulis encrasicolus TaxID=184585 RepID=UPI002FD5D305
MAATWICCNSCFSSASPGNELAVSTCRHIICSRCFKKGNVQQGQCGICKAKCHLSLISDKSSPDVKALFTDLGSTATKYFSEIKGVLQFQARQQKRLLTHYQQRSQNLEETVMKMKQEIQELNKKISQQNMYIHKLESSAHQRYS